MTTYQVAVIAGDGIGKEVMPPAMEVVEAAGQSWGFTVRWTELPWGCHYFQRTGEMMPGDGIAQLSEHDAVLLGAVGAPGVPDHISLWGLLIPIRRAFDQYVNLRPIRCLPGVPGPLRSEPSASTSWSCARTARVSTPTSADGCTAGTADEMAVQESVFTRSAWSGSCASPWSWPRRPRRPAGLGDQVERHHPHDAVLGRAVSRGVRPSYPDSR